MTDLNEMNRTTMRYPKLQQMITAAEYMLECQRDEIKAGCAGDVEAKLAKMVSLESQIESIPYDSGNDGQDASNSRLYDRLEREANVLIREVSELLWPKEETAA